MRLLVDKITDISSAYTLSLPADELNCQLSQSQEESIGIFVGAALIEYTLARIDRRLLLDGELSADLSLQCARCLTPLTEQVKDSFSLALNIIAEEVRVEEEIELSEDLINSISVVAGEVDLSPVLLEQVLLSLPMHSLCREDCSGLCPTCGVDLNKKECTCEARPFNNRFGKLKGLKLDP